MNWQDIAGNQQAQSLLKKVIDNDSVSHAYLFSGLEGVGKRKTASIFAAALNCAKANSPCGVCKVCVSVQNDLPPVQILEPVGKFITIDQVRETKRSFNLKKTADVVSVLIIDKIERLNKEAANALLKLIEEPGANSVIVGVTSNEKSIIPTIISRMQRVTFDPLLDEQVIKVLKERGADDETARLLCDLFPGSVSRGSFWVENPDIFKIYDLVMDMLARASTAGAFNPADEAEALHERIMAFSKKLASGYMDKAQEMVDFAGKKFSKGAVKRLEELDKKELDSSRSAVMKDIFCLFVAFYRDVMIYSQEKTVSGVTNKKHLEYIDACFKIIGVDEVVRLLNMIQNNINNLKFNLDPKLVIEALLFNIREVNSYARGR